MNPNSYCVYRSLNNEIKKSSILSSSMTSLLLCSETPINIVKIFCISVLMLFLLLAFVECPCMVIDVLVQFSL